MKKTILITVFLLAISLSSYAQEGFLGEVRLFAGNFAPRGWALCNGQTLQISQNQALFSILGTMYGGDGRTTFMLPDLRGRAALGTGTGTGLTPVRLGQQSGMEGKRLIKAELAADHETIKQGTLGLNYIICISGIFPSRN